VRTSNRGLQYQNDAYECFSHRLTPKLRLAIRDADQTEPAKEGVSGHWFRRLSSVLDPNEL